MRQEICKKNEELLLKRNGEATAGWLIVTYRDSPLFTLADALHNRQAEAEAFSVL